MNTKSLVNRSAQWCAVGGLCVAMGVGTGLLPAPAAYADPGAGETFGAISGISVSLDKGSKELKMQVKCSGSADPKIGDKLDTPLSLRGVEDQKFEASGSTYTLSGKVNSKEAVASTDVDICAGGGASSKALLEGVSVSFMPEKATGTTVLGFCRQGSELTSNDPSIPNKVGSNIYKDDRTQFAIDVTGTSVELSNFEMCKPYEQRSSTSDSYSSSPASTSSSSSPEPEKDGWLPLPVKPKN